MKNSADIATPTLNPHGTDYETLRDRYSTIQGAVLEALTALRTAAPNAQDYLEDASYRKACAEHRERAAKLGEVFDEVSALLMSVLEQRAEALKL